MNERVESPVDRRLVDRRLRVAPDPRLQVAPDRRLQVQPVRGLRRGVYLAVAGVFFALGALGAVLPGLPTTPFLLLTSYFLVRSSPRLNAALLRSRLFGPILHDWQVRGGVRRAVKLRAVAVIVLVVGASVLLVEWSGTARLATLGLALVGMAVVVRLPEVSASPPDCGERPC